MRPIPKPQTDELEALARENHGLKLLTQFAGALPLSLGVQEIMDRLAPLLREALPHEQLLLSLREGDRLVVRYAAPRGRMTPRVGDALPENDPVHSTALSERRACVGPAPTGGTARKKASRRFLLAAPLLTADAALGTLAVLSEKHGPYSPADASFLQQVADVVAVTLENHRLFHEMREATLEWEETFRSVQDLLAVIDREGRILRANHSFQGIPAEAMLGRRCAEIFEFCGGGKAAAVAKALRSRQEVSMEVTCSEGEQALSVSIYPMSGAKAEAGQLLLYVRDVTAKRKMEAQLFQAAKLAAIGEMAAGVAHELNSPLTAVIGNAGVLLRRVPPEDKSHHLLLDIKTCGQRCKKIIGDMLTFARQDSYVFEPLEINEVVSRGLGLIGYQLEKANIRIETSLRDDLPAILGNAQQIEQVLVNLLLNARDALEGSKRKVIAVSTDYATLDDGHLGLAVTVSDSGAGMAQTTLEKIFDPFFTTKEGAKGTGLGLSVSLGIAKAHGGAISAESKLGAGSTFRLLLPLLAQQVSDYLDAGVASDAAAASLSPETLEDLRPVLELARKLGALRAQLGVEGLAAVDVRWASRTGAWGAGLVASAALEGLFTTEPGRSVRLANARQVAVERGIRVTESAPAAGSDHASSVRLAAQTAAGTGSLAGALFGKQEPRLVELDGIPVEAALHGQLLVFWARNRPGLVGSIASVLGHHGINIRQMRSGSEVDGGLAVAVFNVDGTVSDHVLSALRNLPGLSRVARASL